LNENRTRVHLNRIKPPVHTFPSPEKPSSFKGFITNDKIEQYISNGYIVILNVHNGGHWVLATSFQGDTIYVNDPGYSTTYYTLAQIVNGNTGVYTLNRMPNFLTSWLLSIEEFVNSILGK